MKHGNEPHDAGFTLIEVLSALAVIGVVLSATTAYFIRTMTTVDEQGARQTAVQVATDGLEGLRSVTGTQALTWLQSQPAQAPITVNSLTYTRSWTYPTAPTNGLLAATVVVTWPARDCPASGCSYQATTQISTATVEPVFEASA
jgi:prepilin-type N-terminal cleavage/methylation domain-containing protein